MTKCSVPLDCTNYLTVPKEVLNKTPTSLNYLQENIMYELFEATMFDYIGCGLLLCIASFYAIVVGVFVCNVVCGLIWEWLQDGDEKLDNWLKKIMPFLVEEGGVVEYKGKYIVKYARSYSDKFYYGSESYSVDQAYRFDEYYITKEEAQEKYDSLFEYKKRDIFVVSNLFYPLTLIIPAVGFLAVPTTTLFIIGVVLTAYVARSAIRLKKRFDKHVADKGVHK